ncbi:hypothetical protein [Metabacillus sp. FJAT-52054]|uniref:Lipoprotein n=1 Tax=Metabacillus sediminis TaxID=3117746 RepID=A0ABZ2NJ81_9BACI
MKNKSILILLIVLSILSACNSNKNEIKDSPLYKGKELTIGIIGKPPAIREENIVFRKMELKGLSEKNLASKFNSVFIMKEHLSEAAKASYASIYRNSGIPFFFIESKKSYIPFVLEDADYEDFSDSKSGYYASGYYQSGEEGRHWEFGLYNDKVNKVNILDAYSRIFKTIETVDNGK